MVLLLGPLANGTLERGPLNDHFWLQSAAQRQREPCPVNTAPLQGKWRPELVKAFLFQYGSIVWGWFKSPKGA